MSTLRAEMAVALLVPTVFATSCGWRGETPSGATWKIVDARFLPEDDGCCNAPAAVVLGLFAASELAMPGNSLKIAVGCRKQGQTVAVASMLEMKVRDRFGASEAFDNARLDTVTECAGFAGPAATAAIFELIREPARVWQVTARSDDDLCELVRSPGNDLPAAIIMRALEEIASRRLSECAEPIETLALAAGDEVALRAVGTLGRIGSDSSLMTLGRLTLSDDPRIPWAAIHAIADIGGPDAVRALEIAAGQSSTPTLAREAAQLAEEIRKRLR